MEVSLDDVIYRATTVYILTGTYMVYALFHFPFLHFWFYYLNVDSRVQEDYCCSVYIELYSYIHVLDLRCRPRSDSLLTIDELRCTCDIKSVFIGSL